MRLSDGPTTEVTLTMRASPTAIWHACTDPKLPLENSEELVEAHWDPDGPEPGVGARLIGTNQRGETTWVTTSHVVQWEPDRCWSYEVGSPDSVSQWWYLLDDHGDGTVTVTQRVRLGPGPSGLTAAIDRKPDMEERIIEYRLGYLAESMKGNLETIESRAAS